MKNKTDKNQNNVKETDFQNYIRYARNDMSSSVSYVMVDILNSSLFKNSKRFIVFVFFLICIIDLSVPMVYKNSWARDHTPVTTVTQAAAVTPDP